MKYIVNYKEHCNNDGNLIRPYFIEDARHFYTSGKWIGITCDTDLVYLPDTVVKMTNQEVIDWVVALTDLIDDEGNPLTVEQKIELANRWLEQKGFN